MDISFSCPTCKQELAVDPSAAGSTIECPTCNTTIIVPQPEVETPAPAPAAASAEPAPSYHGHEAHPINAMASSAASKIERHFSVPVHDSPAEILIQKKAVVEEAPAAGAEKKLKIRIFRHTDCIEVGHDRYEELVGAFLNKIGKENIVTMFPLNYTHVDIASQKVLTDYAFQIVYVG
jgi:hypothetical protein